MDPQLRVGDAEREQTVAELRRYAATGYLSAEELTRRSAAVYQARTHGDLAAVTADLPASDLSGPPRAGERSGRSRWSPVAIALAVVAAVAAAAFAAMVIIMMVMMMMGGMGGMDGMP